MFLVIQFWVQLYKFHNGNFLTVCKSCTHVALLAEEWHSISSSHLSSSCSTASSIAGRSSISSSSPLNQLLCNFYSFLYLTFLLPLIHLFPSSLPSFLFPHNPVDKIIKNSKMCLLTVKFALSSSIIYIK